METDIRQTTTTALDSGVTNYEVDSVVLDTEQDQNETYWDNAYYNQYLGYYKKIPEFKTALDAFAIWVIGKGWTSNNRTTAILDNIDGWGEDTFQSIIWNLLVMKKLQGDAFAEIIRNKDTGALINIKPLGTLRIVTNKNGRVIRYEQRDRKEVKKYKPQEILHLCNNRLADEIHGTPITESVKWVIDARNEAMSDWRRISHRSTVRVLYIDEDDTSKLSNLKRDYKDAINKGELIILPTKAKDAEFSDLTLPPVEAFLSWIKYLENFFYQALGVPKVILGGSEEFTEASSKIGYLTFEQVYSKEVSELKADLWNQLGIRIEINKPASLKNEMLTSEEKNTGQVGFQPNDVMAGVGK